MEGVADRRSAGHIAVDNIQIMDGLNAEDCKGVCCVVKAHLVHQIYTFYTVILLGDVQERNSQKSLFGFTVH